jgi:NADH-quinone oxidoreductase subunit B
MSALIEKIIKWSRSKSLWMIHYCSACGAVEFPPLVMSPLDWERYGYMPVPSPRQADFYAAMGYLTKKSVKLFLNMYRQMSNPKYSVAGCNCAATGGLYWDSFSTYKRFDEFVKVEGWVPGCMPSPDDWTRLITDIYERISERSVNDKGDDLVKEAFEKIKNWEEEERRWAREYEEKLRSSSELVDYYFEDRFDECIEYLSDLKICVTTVDKERLREALTRLMKDGFKLFININTVDLPMHGVIELYYIVEKPESGEQKWVKTYVKRKDPIIRSVHDIYPLAFYVEKEVHEMMGVVFEGHPDLSKWILEGNWEGPPPLRKDVDTAEWVVKTHYGGYRYGR